MQDSAIDSGLGPAGDGATQEDDGSDPGDAEDQPQVSLPLPYLSGSAMAAPDGAQDSIFQAQSGLNPDFALYAVNVSQGGSLAAFQHKKPKTFYAKVKLWMNAQAKSMVNALASNAFAVENTCFPESAYVQKIIVNADGSADPQAIHNVEPGDVIEFVYIGADCKIGEAAQDTPNKHVLFVAIKAASSDAVTTDGSSIYQINPTGFLSKIAYDNGQYKMKFGTF